MIKKGMVPNPHGRPKGSKNKVSVEIREDFAYFLNYASPKIVSLWDRLCEESPRDALKALNDFAEFVLPKLSRSEGDHKHEVKMIIESAIKGLPNSDNQEDNTSI